MRSGTMARAVVAAALGCAAAAQTGRASACEPCADYDTLCCDIPADNLYVLTSFTGGEGMACGGNADGTWYYSTSWVRWYCDARLRITNPESGDCVVVQVADAGPASWVEDDAGMPIIDASPLVCEGLFDSSSCGWSDGFVIEAVQVSDDTPLGPEGCVSDTDSGGDTDADADTDADGDAGSDADGDTDTDEDTCGGSSGDGACGCCAAGSSTAGQGVLGALLGAS